MNISPSIYESRTPPTSDHGLNKRRMTISRICEVEEIISHDRIFQSNSISPHSSAEVRALRTIPRYCCTRTFSTSKATGKTHHLTFSDADVQSILKGAYEALDRQ